MFFSTIQMPSTKTMVSAAASAAATAMLVRKIAREYLPHEVRAYLFLKLKNFVASFSTELTLIIEERDDGLDFNKLFNAAKLYLEPRFPPNLRRIKIHVPRKKIEVSLSAEKKEEIIDIFNGVHLKWKFVSKQGKLKHLYEPDNFGYSVVQDEVKFFELSFHKRHKEMILESYIPHVLEKCEEINKQKRTVKLYTRSSDAWQSVNLDHPATFDTLAMDSDVKRMVMEDLERFVRRKEFYKRVGKAWKRGYLLFGPPGTGKSSLIAAMANYLKFDIYDLDLANLKGNYKLRRLLLATENKSILVVEDIDCSIEAQDRLSEARAINSLNSNQGNQFQMNLSGLLNFVDGLWSSTGDERIIVFSTNHKERLDPALLRPGRMDLHVQMSYCTPCGFKMLAYNYLGTTEHPLFSEIEELIKITKVTPAEIGEQLLKDEVAENALRSLVEFLENKKRENYESKASSQTECSNISSVSMRAKA